MPFRSSYVLPALRRYAFLGRGGRHGRRKKYPRRRTIRMIVSFPTAARAERTGPGNGGYFTNIVKRLIDVAASEKAQQIELIRALEARLRSVEDAGQVH